MEKSKENERNTSPNPKKKKIQKKNKKIQEKSEPLLNPCLPPSIQHFLSCFIPQQIKPADSLWRSTAGYCGRIQRHCCELCENVNRSQFWEKINSLGTLMQPGGIYLLYYAGHGMEIKNSFHFVPKGAEDETGCVSLGEVMAHFDKVAAARKFRCEVIFCINACRHKLPSAIPDPPDNEYGQRNRYHILFATSAGEEVPIVEGKNTQPIFPNVVAEMIPEFTNENVSLILSQILDTIQKRDEQQNPWLLSGGLGDPSSRASSSSSFSFPPPANVVDRLQGIWVKKGLPCLT